MPNPLRCFNCQRFGHYESNCPVDIGSVCEKCGTGGHDHHTSSCKNKPKCVNCGKEHLSRSNTCEIWKKEKEIMKIKATKNVTYLEAKKLSETQSPELDFSKIVQSLSSKPETKNNRYTILGQRFHYSPFYKGYHSIGQTKIYLSTSVTVRFSASIKYKVSVRFISFSFSDCFAVYFTI